MDLGFKWIGGASFILSLEGGLKIAVDPVLCPKGTIQNFFWFRSTRLVDPSYTKADYDGVDLWLITHNHEDHLDEIGLSKINTSDRVVCNKNSYKKLQKHGVEDLHLLKHHQIQSFTIKNYEIHIQAVPAVHGINPLSALFAGNVNGYYVQIRKGNKTRTIYITSDTIFRKSLLKKIQDKNIDLLIPNMGAAKQGSWIMTLTLNAKMLKKLVDYLNPGLVIPVHYGTFKHYVEPVERIIKIDDPRIIIVPEGNSVNISIKAD